MEFGLFVSFLLLQIVASIVPDWQKKRMRKKFAPDWELAVFAHSGTWFLPTGENNDSSQENEESLALSSKNKALLKKALRIGGAGISAYVLGSTLWAALQSGASVGDWELSGGRMFVMELLALAGIGVGTFTTDGIYLGNKGIYSDSGKLHHLWEQVEEIRFDKNIGQKQLNIAFIIKKGGKKQTLYMPIDRKNVATAERVFREAIQQLEKKVNLEIPGL